MMNFPFVKREALLFKMAPLRMWNNKLEETEYFKKIVKSREKNYEIFVEIQLLQQKCSS